MPSISLPLWIFAVAVGLPSASLCWLVLSLIFRRRKRVRLLASQAQLSSLPRPQGISGRFQQDLIALQIDAVFNGLVALVETERIKLKRLMLNNAPEQVQVFDSSSGAARPEIEIDEWETPAADHNQIERQIARCAAEGNAPDGIANHLGLSMAEVELAIKMKRARGAHSERKLEAVA
jgi:hypothetical protein